MGQRNLHLCASNRAEHTGQKFDGFSFFCSVCRESRPESEFRGSELACRGRTRDTYSIEADKLVSSAAPEANVRKACNQGPTADICSIEGCSASTAMANTISRFGLVVALTIGVAISASGQGRGFSAPMHASSAPARSFSGAGHGFAGRPRGTGTRPGAFSRPGFAPPLVGTPLNPNFAPLRGVPGLGFDFEHLAAIERPFRGRFGRGDRDRGGFFTPLFFDGLPLYYPGGYPYDTENPYDNAVPDNYTGAAQPPIFVVPQPQPNTSAPAETAPRQVATPQAPPPPPPELGQLILVRSDGQVLLAVAFTVRNGQLSYITNEGTKRSFPVSELDKQATQQMNDANGTSVSFP